MTTPLLQVEGLRAGYGVATVIRSANFEVRDGEIVVLLGSNGAGKTTMLRALSGMTQRSGVIRLAGVDLVRMRPDSVARAGVAHVPQGRGTFPGLTVDDNLRIGGYRRRRRQLEQDIALWYEHFPRLAERRAQLAGAMSGGEQQMLAIARAMMSAPKLLLLDEPSLGLAPNITEGLFAKLAELNAAVGLAILVVEQNAALALEIANRAYILESGELSRSWQSQELAASDDVRKAYLGQ